MRPLKLTMRGFGSFRDETEVDFDGLELAALIGPTGSGKSTIIDGITFALFGSVARYDDARAVEPVINQLVQEAAVSLDFEVGGERYTAARVVRRTEGGATTREARLQNGDTVLAGAARQVTEVVERLLGLDFDRFTKTVVLPQGRFAKFLHDKARDRQELLRHLLDLGVYTRMGERARERARDISARIEALEPGLEVPVPTREQAAELDAAAQRARAAQSELEAVMDDLAAAADELRSARDEMQRIRPLHDLAVGAAAVPDNVTILADNLRSAERALESAKATFRDARQQAQEAVRQAEAGPDEQRCKRLVEAHARLAELRKKCEKCDAGVQSARRAADAASLEAEKLRQCLGEAEARADDARRAATGARRSAAEGPQLAEIEALRNRWSELERLGARVGRARQRSLVADEAEAEAQARLREAQRVFDDASETLDRVRAVHQAAGLAAQMREGERCPVCRQTVAEIPHHDASAELEQCRAAHEKAQRGRKIAEAEHDEARGEQAAAHAQEGATRDGQEELAAYLRDQPDIDELDRQQKRAEELDDVARAAEAGVVTAENAARGLREDDATRRVLDAEGETKDALATAQADRAGLLGQRDELAAQLDSEPAGDKLGALIDEVHRLADARAQASAAEEEADGAVQAALGELDERRAEENRARHKYSEVRDRLAPLSPPLPGGPLIADWQNFAAWASRQVGELAAQAEAAECREAGAEGRVRDLRDRARGLCEPFFDPGDDPSKYGVELGRAALSAEHAREQAAIAREKRDRLTRQIAGLRRDKDVASQLGQMLRSDGFEAWLMAEAVAALVERANTRLMELSGGQYSFLADGTSFDVCDHHNADEARGAKSLSGGETFLASLALALALSDSQAEMAPEGTPELGSLFLDEGFGTLDPDTLAVVAGALAELGATGRMVCVVTHVRELADEMPVRFEVSKGTASSSVERVEA